MHLIAVSDTRVFKWEEKEHSNVCVANRYQGINEVCVIVSGAGTINMSTWSSRISVMFSDYGDKNNKLDEKE